MTTRHDREVRRNSPEGVFQKHTSIQVLVAVTFVLRKELLNTLLFAMQTVLCDVLDQFCATGCAERYHIQLVAHGFDHLVAHDGNVVVAEYSFVVEVSAHKMRRAVILHNNTFVFPILFFIITFI